MQRCAEGPREQRAAANVSQILENDAFAAAAGQDQTGDVLHDDDDDDGGGGAGTNFRDASPAA